MSKVKLQTVKKEGTNQYSKEFDFDLAEKMLRKSKNWELAPSNGYEFKDGTLVEKGKANQPAKKSE